jgi:hypothetical protein
LFASLFFFVFFSSVRAFRLDETTHLESHRRFASTKHQFFENRLKHVNPLAFYAETGFHRKNMISSNPSAFYVDLGAAASTKHTILKNPKGTSKGAPETPKEPKGPRGLPRDPQGAPGSSQEAPQDTPRATKGPPRTPKEPLWIHTGVPRGPMGTQGTPTGAQKTQRPPNGPPRDPHGTSRKPSPRLDRHSGSAGAPKGKQLYYYIIIICLFVYYYIIIIFLLYYYYYIAIIT